jgi:hypothetical protein
MKKLIPLLFLLVCGKISAQEELLQFQDVVIEGEGAMQDSLQLFSKMQASSKPDSMSFFRFEPYPAAQKFSLPAWEITNDRFYSSWQVSSSVSAQAKVGWQFAKNFYTTAQAVLQDLPAAWKNEHFQASLNYTRNTNWLSADYSGFHSQNRLYDTDINRFQLGINKKWQNFELFGQGGWQQLQQANYDDKQFPLKASAQFQADKFDTKINFYHLLGESNVSFKLLRRHTLWLDELGLWSAYDGDEYYFSAVVSKNLQLSRQWQLFLQNNPRFIEKTISQLWQQNYFFDLDVQMPQTKIPVNLATGVQLNAQIPWKIEYNLLKYEDKFVFRENGIGYYQLQQTNLWQQKFKTELFYQIDGLEILPQFIYNQYSQDMAYLPKVQAKLKVAYKQPSWQLQARLQINRDRQDETGADLPDIHLLEISGSLQLSPNIALTATANNLLDEDTSFYSLLPQQECQIWLGVQITD